VNFPSKPIQNAGFSKQFWLLANNVGNKHVGRWPTFCWSYARSVRLLIFKNLCCSETTLLLYLLKFFYTLLTGEEPQILPTTLCFDIPFELFIW